MRRSPTTKAPSDGNPRPSRRRPAVEVRHVQPVQPERSQFPSGVEGTHKYREAEAAYETALLAFAAEVGVPADIADDIAALGPGCR